MNLRHRIGFMQGRLVDTVNGRIQAFPASQWREEFPAAQSLGLNRMEWTLDAEGLSANPFCSASGRDEIRQLGKRYAVKVDTVTGDCFMQRPFWKAKGAEIEDRLEDLDLVIRSAASLGLRHIVIPLVDNGSLECTEQELLLVERLLERLDFMRSAGLGIAFESDFPPQSLARFIKNLPDDVFGINYDIGNSASLDFDPSEEFFAYGHRIVNVHIKDRMRDGTTVPLGQGNADFDAVFRHLASCQYDGLLILQTARASEHSHAKTLGQYLDFTLSLMSRHLGS